MATVLAVCRCRRVPSRWCSALREGVLAHQLVGEAADGEEAEWLFASRRPDLVLVDLPSFGEDAPVLCRRLTEAGEATGNPASVLAVAPQVAEEERAALLEAGASGYILAAIDDDSMSIALQAIADVAGKKGAANGNGSHSRPAQFLGTEAA